MSEKNTKIIIDGVEQEELVRGMPLTEGETIHLHNTSPQRRKHHGLASRISITDYVVRKKTMISCTKEIIVSSISRTSLRRSDYHGE